METLIDSSDLTRQWLRLIESRVRIAIASINYSETKHWAKFISSKKDRVIAWLRPYRNSIIIFIKLELETESDLEPTPSTHTWAESYPTIFRINSELKIERGAELIIKSYRYDLYR